MIIKIHKISFVIVVSLIFSFEVSTQDLSPEFLASLPEDVQAEILSTAQQNRTWKRHNIEGHLLLFKNQSLLV